MTALWVICMVGGNTCVLVDGVRTRKGLHPSGWLIVVAAAFIVPGVVISILGLTRGWS